MSSRSSASIPWRAEYFKFNDQQRYVMTIRKLAARQFDPADGRLIETFGKTGMRHVLEGRSAQMRRLRDLIRRYASVPRTSTALSTARFRNWRRRVTAES